MPSDRRSDVPIFNMCCQIALCKYLDAYVNAMARAGFVQSNGAQDLLDFKFPRHVFSDLGRSRKNNSINNKALTRRALLFMGRLAVTYFRAGNPH